MHRIYLMPILLYFRHNKYKNADLSWESFSSKLYRPYIVRATIFYPHTYSVSLVTACGHRNLQTMYQTGGISNVLNTYSPGMRLGWRTPWQALKKPVHSLQMEQTRQKSKNQV